MKTVVFVGPTLSRDQASLRLAAQLCPPAAQGDIYRAVQAGARVIGLIDGLFLNVASVWHKEVLYALAQGVHVFGAASMGALRAAELDAFGMQGVGLIYNCYRSGTWAGCPGVFEDDDEVAVTHTPPDLGSLPLSDAMVDIRATLLAAAADGVISESRSFELMADAKALHYSQRRLSALSDSEPCLREWMAINSVSQKTVDALQMLDCIASFIQSDPTPHIASFRFEHADVWEVFVDAEAAQDRSPEAARVLDALRLDPHAWRIALRAVIGRGLSVIPAGSGERLRQLDRLRVHHGLWQRTDLDSWMSANGLDVAGTARLLDAEAALDVIAERGRSGPAEFSLTRKLIDHLRITGAYAELLKHAPPSDWTLQPSAAARDWYFDSLGIPKPTDIDVWVTANGWPSRASFERAVSFAANRSATLKPI